MASVISFFSTQSTWQAMGVSFLPVLADQLVQQVFSKKFSASNLKKASLATAGVTYLLLSRHLPSSFKIGAPILYLAYKAAQYFFSQQTPPGSKDDSSNSKSPTSPVTTKPKAKDRSDKQSSEPPVTTVKPSTTTKEEHDSDNQLSEPLVTTGKLSTTTEEEHESDNQLSGTPVTAENALITSIDQMIAHFAPERQAALRFQQIMERVEKSEAMSFTILEKPLLVDPSAKGKKAKQATFKATIIFGKNFVFKMSKNTVNELNREGCAVTEDTLFFWFNMSGKKAGKIPTVNFIPLTMLDNLRPNATEFSMPIIESDCQMILQFKQEHMIRLKAFAKTIKTCQKVETIHSGAVNPHPLSTVNNRSTAPEGNALLANDMASVNGAKCYLKPFMKKS